MDDFLVFRENIYRETCLVSRRKYLQYGTVSKVKDAPPTDNEAEEEFSVEKVLDRRVVKGKVCKRFTAWRLASVDC